MSTKLSFSLASILILVVPAATSAYGEVAPAPLWQAPDGTPGKSAAPPTTPPAHKHRTPAKRDAAGTNKSTDALEAEVFGNEPAPTVRRPPADDDRADETYGGAHTRATGNLPAIVAPHMIAFALGTELISRSFHFNSGSSLQGDAGAPRAGIAAAIESFPFLSLDNRQLGRIGVGASFATEVGNAGIGQPDNGTLIYPFTETRWGFDVRYALPIGRAVPAAAALRLRPPRLRPGTAQSTGTVAVRDHQHAGLPARRAGLASDAGPRRAAGARAVGGAVAGAGVPAGLRARAWRGPAGLRIGRQRAGNGGHAAPRAGSSSTGWRCARRCRSPTYSYTFSRRPLAYTSASETYYGLVVGATVFAR